LLVQAAAKVAWRIRKDMPPPALLRFFPESPLRPADSFMPKENEGMSELEVFKRIISLDPEYPATYRLLAATLGQLGHVEEARAALQRATSISPASFDSFVSARAPHLRPADYEHILEGLRKAGWRADLALMA
jgi:tetratricopeptide repeat protein